MTRSLFAAVLVAVPLVLCGTGSAETPPDRATQNLTDFDFMADKITTNYAGYDTKVTDANRAALSDLTTRLRAKAGEASDGELTALLTEWSGFFHEGHAALLSAYPRRWWRVLHNTEQIPIS